MPFIDVIILPEMAFMRNQYFIIIIEIGDMYIFSKIHRPVSINMGRFESAKVWSDRICPSFEMTLHRTCQHSLCLFAVCHIALGKLKCKKVLPSFI